MATTIDKQEEIPGTAVPLNALQLEAQRWLILKAEAKLSKERADKAKEVVIAAMESAGENVIKAPDQLGNTKVIVRENRVALVVE